MEFQGNLKKMASVIHDDNKVSYFLDKPGEAEFRISDHLEKKVSINFSGQIFCCHCQRKIKKTFNQGYCFPCLQALAQCDQCMIKPELCHYDQGTCREPSWGEEHCMIPHTVYLAHTSGLKVGITRNTRVRWVDQGATQALPLARVTRRLDAGLMEQAFKLHVNDKTNWRTMLKQSSYDLDMQAEAERLFQLLNYAGNYERLEESVQTLVYPVKSYPEKIKSHNLDKAATVEGVLLGIKGQYLILDTGVINLRKFTGYQCKLLITP